MLLNCGVGEDSLEFLAWTATRSDKSILKEINPEYSLKGLKLMLKLQYLGYLMQRANSLGKTLMLGKTEGKRRRGRQRMRQLYSTTDSVDMNLRKFQEIVKDREAWHAAVHGVTESDTTKQLNNETWVELPCGTSGKDLYQGGTVSFPFLPLLLLMTQEQTWSPETPSALACETWQSRRGKVCEEFLNKRKLSNLQTWFTQEHKPRV